MKTLVATFVLAGIVLASAAPVSAGLHFADSFSTGPGSTPTTTITINGSGGTYDPVGTVDVSGTANPNTAVLDVNWTTQPAQMNSAGANDWDMVIWFGSITGSGLALTAVSLSEDGSTFVQETFGQFIDATTYSNKPYFLYFDDSTISTSQRDHVTVARIVFSFNSGTTFTVDGVSTPEPGTFALFGFGLLGLGGAMWRRRRKKA